MKPFIDAKGLVHEYSRRDEEGNVTGINRALDGIDIEVKAGDFIAGMALSSADKAGTWVTVQVTKSGYKAATAG